MLHEPIVVQRDYLVPVEDVWRAITEPERMREWYFETMPDFRPEVGFETRFVVRVEDREFTHCWKVTDVVPCERIVYTWRFSEYSGVGATAWELRATDGGTKLTLTNTGIESFPRDVPEFSRASCRAGWEFFLGERLQAYLEP